MAYSRNWFISASSIHSKCTTSVIFQFDKSSLISTKINPDRKYSDRWISYTVCPAKCCTKMCSNEKLMVTTNEK